MKKVKVIQSLSFAAAVLLTLGAAQMAQADVKSDNTKEKVISIARVDPSSPEYIEVSTEAEFRDAVEQDNGKTYIKMKDNIRLLQGQVVVPASKTSLTIDGAYTTPSGLEKRHALQSGYPKITDFLPPEVPRPPQVTDTTKQKMIYVNNSSTKEVILTDVWAETNFLDGVVKIDNAQSDVTVTMNNTDIEGPMGVYNHNGVVNFTGTSRVELYDTYNDLLVLHARGMAESNIINVYGQMQANDFLADKLNTRWFFRMNESSGFEPHLTFMPGSKLTTDYNEKDAVQYFVGTDSGKAVLNLMKGSEVNVKTLSLFDANQDLSNVMVDTDASLIVKRVPGKNSPNNLGYSTITTTKGFTAKSGSTVVVENDSTAKITGHTIEVGANAALDVLNPKRFDVSGPYGVALFGDSSGANLLNVSAENSLKGWTDATIENPTHVVSGPLQAQWSWYGGKPSLIFSTVDNFLEAYPLNEMQRMLVE